MKRRQFVGAGLSLAAAWPLSGWTAVLKGIADLPVKTLDGGDVVLRGSSIEAFARTLTVHERTLRRLLDQGPTAPRRLGRKTVPRDSPTLAVWSGRTHELDIRPSRAS